MRAFGWSYLIGKFLDLTTGIVEDGHNRSTSVVKNVTLHDLKLIKINLVIC